MATRLGGTHGTTEETARDVSERIGEPQTMAELLAESEAAEQAVRPLAPGEMVEGAVASINGDEVLVDLGGRSAGLLSLREAGEALEVGDHIFAFVVQPEGPQGNAVLSLRKARRERRWLELADLERSGRVIEAEVLEANRGGVVVDVGLRGFVPLSQLASLGALERPADAETREVPEPVRGLVGRRLSLKVIEVDPKRNRLILSEKAATQELRRRRKARAAAELKPGDVLDGIVTHVTGFGLFVDVGVADGLVHRTEISWDKAVKPMSLHKVGDRVRVAVTAIDKERERISLSIKRLANDPWERIGTEFALGADADGTVTRLMPFGAFVRIADDLEGLVHVSELAPHRVAHPSEVVQVGDQVRVRIVGVDPERRRLSLSIRQAERL
ncbi:MAG: 30S ribosomal protein S1 [Candidatus Limnocylindria bacterium]